MASDIVIGAARQAIDFLSSREIEYALIGGIAAQLWGRVRSTLDVDLLVMLDTTALEQAIPELAAAGLYPRRPNTVSIGSSAVLQLAFADAGSLLDVRVDLLTAGTAFHKQVIHRAIKAKLGSSSVRLSRCEDLVVLKLLAERPIDRVDAQVLCQVNRPDLDLDYLRACAESLGIADALDACLKS